MISRNVVNLAFQFQKATEVSHALWLGKDNTEKLTRYYGGDNRHKRLADYVAVSAGIDNFMSYAGFTPQENGTQRDVFGCICATSPAPGRWKHLTAPGFLSCIAWREQPFSQSNPLRSTRGAVD